MVAEPPRVRTVNPLGLQLRAQCTLQRTQDLSGCQLLCVFLAHDYSGGFVFWASHCALTVVCLWHVMVNRRAHLLMCLWISSNCTPSTQHWDRRPILMFSFHQVLHLLDWHFLRGFSGTILYAFLIFPILTPCPDTRVGQVNALGDHYKLWSSLLCDVINFSCIFLGCE